jgi:hypothetical protein
MLATWMMWTKLLFFDSFFCAMIAAITLRLLDPFGTGKLVLFQVTYDKVSTVGKNMSLVELFLNLLSGLACL